MAHNPAVASRWGEGPAQRLDRLLAAAGVRNVDLATDLGLHQSTFSKYRSGERVPDATVLAHMLERCEGSADDVLGLRPATIDPATLRDAVSAARRLVDAAPSLAGALPAKKDKP